MTLEATLLTIEEAAAYIGFSPWTLRKWRSLGRGPSFVRLGGKLGSVRYRLCDLDAYMEASVVHPDAQNVAINCKVEG